MSENPWLASTSVNDVTVLQLLTDKILDESAILMMGELMFATVDEDGATKVLIDFSRVIFLSAMFLGKLITMHRKLQYKGGKLVLCGFSKDCLELLTVTKLNLMLTIRDNQTEGLMAF